MPNNTPLVATYLLNEQTLSRLDKDSLYQLLEHKTRIFIAAKNIGMPENSYTKQLRLEISAIKHEINMRNTN